MNNLLKLRKEKKLTRPELSKISGVPASTIHKLEIGVNDMKGAKGDTLYRLANALDTTVEHLLQYYLKPSIGTIFEEAELKAILILKDEWRNLQWESTVQEGFSHEVATSLGYKVFAKMNTLDYCYEKDNELYVFRGHGVVTYAKLPQKPSDVIENDGVICNGCYTSLNSIDELPR